ncbi:uncharacterized protein LOC143184326 [Calliopsis andreniformis]|uniref:uncharacterized protein LOC143184326 n=1 Tax=Calliopsis andreniformis TaxID=337506 RepID=UPI003FCD2B23
MSLDSLHNVPESEQYKADNIQGKPFSLTKYRYYDKPEGQDPFGKVMSLAVPTFYGSLVFGIHDVYIRARCATFPYAFARLAFWVIPPPSIAAVFASVTYISTRLRKKDDPINYAAGAIATVPIFKAWFKLPFVVSLQVGSVVTFIAVMYKGLNEGFERGSKPYKSRSESLPQYY